MPTRKKTRRKKTGRNRHSIRGGSRSGERVKNLGKRVGEMFSGMTGRKPQSNKQHKAEQQSQSNEPYKAEQQSQSKGCPNESLTIGRMVSFTDGKIYFISKIDSKGKGMELHDGTNVERKWKDKITPYNYHDILGKIHILLDIIISKKYLNLDDNAKTYKYLDIINHIQSIVNNIKKIDVYSSLQVEAYPITMGKAFPLTMEETAYPKGQSGGSCIEEQPSSGRLVQHNDDFYYVSLNGNKMTNKKGNFDIPTDASPYNYDEVLSSLLSLFKIILEKKYLYDNNHDNNHIDKMNIIKTIIVDINNIDETEQTIDANPNNNKIYNLNNIVSDTESVKNPLLKKMNADNHTNLTKRASSNSKRRAPRNLNKRFET